MSIWYSVDDDDYEPDSALVGSPLPARDPHAKYAPDVYRRKSRIIEDPSSDMDLVVDGDDISGYAPDNPESVNAGQNIAAENTKIRGAHRVYDSLRTNSIFQAPNRRGNARARLDAINAAYHQDEPTQTRRFKSRTEEVRIWLLMHELAIRELAQFEVATTFAPGDRDRQSAHDVDDLIKRVKEEVIDVLVAQEAASRSATDATDIAAVSDAQYIRELCAAKAAFVLNNFYDHIGGINMRGRAQATGGFTTEELRRNNVLRTTYDQDHATYETEPGRFPGAARKLFSTIRPRREESVP